MYEERAREDTTNMHLSNSSINGKDGRGLKLSKIRTNIPTCKQYKKKNKRKRKKSEIKTVGDDKAKNYQRSRNH